MDMILRAYRALFARRVFFRLNKLLYRLGLCGMGVLNYESPRASGEERFLQKYLGRKLGGVVFDVGANVGGYSRKVLRVCPQATVYAFEPHPKTYKTLEKAIDHPGFFPINAAVGEAEGETSLFDYMEQDGSSHASIYRGVIENIHKAASIEHRVKIIDLLGFARSKNLEKIDLLKVDTEGNEFGVLKGIYDYIKDGKVEAIHFEFNEMNVSSRTYFKDFWDLLSNYDLYRLLPDGMIQIDTYNPVFCEIFAYQNIVAILKGSRADV